MFQYLDASAQYRRYAAKPLLANDDDYAGANGIRLKQADCILDA